MPGQADEWGYWPGADSLERAIEFLLINGRSEDPVILFYVIEETEFGAWFTLAGVLPGIHYPAVFFARNLRRGLLRNLPEFLSSGLPNRLPVFLCRILQPRLLVLL